MDEFAERARDLFRYYAARVVSIGISNKFTRRSTIPRYSLSREFGIASNVVA